MNDDEFESLLARIKRIKDDWAPMLPGGWSITHVYDREQKPGGPTCMADSSADWRYMHATVTFYLGTLWAKEINDDELRECYVHELMHIFVRECREYTDNWQLCDLDHEERVCTTLARNILDMTNAIADRWRKHCPSETCPVGVTPEQKEVA